MSDITITFPAWMILSVLLGEATPVLTLVLAALAVAFFRTRGSSRTALLRGLKLSLIVLSTVWLGGVGFWTIGLVDDIRGGIYRAKHHYRLDKATAMAGLDIPASSWVTLGDDGRLYAIETTDNTAVAIDGALWRGEIYLIPPYQRTPTNRGTIKNATLAVDATIQGIPCRGGQPVEFSEFGGDLISCLLARPTEATAEITDANGAKTARRVACAPEREIRFRILGDKLLERCVLAAPATIGSVSCAGGEEILLDGAGLAACTLSSAQRIGPLDLAAGTPVGFVNGHLDRFSIPPGSAPVTVSDLALPPGSDVHLCDGPAEIDWVVVPASLYVAISGVKLTGRLNFACGRFQYGFLYEDAEVAGRRLARGAGLSYDDLHPQPAR